ncbi:MAG: Stk1 family PASTA domain-containing Ser/Thr kinase [Faecalibacterium sp.]|nr:Stk1 family PASTA domain-containing Ser/Thr kinase [Ruminococcus sp.]MCM1392993.1 Stk1 family PASTA domain-containing Ser/Thr kinase [Ruminococcus sp.]MCM1484927.1 Stk1 family PASTA domain-containing Ser/Thr kinase [Faecalibacterium sp.]
MENYVGKRLDGRYEIIEILGVGGMAVVYKAYDNIDGRIVAVKILKDEFIANEDFRRRFKNESKAIALLSHPNIVKVYDVSYGDRLQYIVMEYVDGITLKEYIQQQGTVNTREAIYFVTQILRALQHAHDKGIVHRDIKPQNIMLISDGTIKVTDFGIARFSRSETSTMTDMAIGSVHYISPEQAKGSVTDAKTDVYSVGVVLYEMLTGRLPFQSDNAVSVAIMQLQNNPVNPREINPNIPVGLEQIIIRAMQKNQSDRYQSASEMLMDIEKYKRNPNIKFDYSYYVDKQPTKYVSVPVQDKKPAAVREPKAVEPIEDNGDEPDNKSKKRTITILAVALAALVLFAIAIVAIVQPNKNKFDVPNLVGMNFTDEVMNNDDYSMFTFDIQDDAESDKDAGTIVKQEPNKGKLERGGTITVYVAKASKQVEVPDVYGYEYTSAVNVLKSANFSVTIEKVYDKDKDSETVIRTSPARNEMADAGSTITVYVATGESSEPVDVPNLLGLTVSEAKDALEKVGLALDSRRTEYRASTENKGEIIGYEHIGEEVAVGTEIAVYVSTGKPPVTTTEPTTTEAPTEATTKKEKETTKPKPTEPSTTKAPKTTQPTEPSTTAPEKPTKATEPITTKPTQAPITTSSQPQSEAPLEEPNED